MTDRAWLVVRRVRVGSMLANAIGGDGEAILLLDRDDAEEWRASMRTPRDWDILRVTVTIDEETGGA